jgi:hypothetical protein
MADFRVRALEIHSRYAWDFDWVRRALDFIAAQGMTALVLHRNDIVDRIVWPSRYFGGTGPYRNIFERYRDIHRSLYRYTPTRRSGPYHRRDYLRRVIALAGRLGIEVYFQNKELFFHEIFLELRPELAKGGAVCPTEPFWWEFLETKYTELFEELPDLAGIITAPGTGESKASIAANRCRCARCASCAPQDWFAQLLGAIHRPIRRAGKTFVVRDFVFDKKSQDRLAASFDILPSDVIISFKNTPHDYYPTFPDNPRLGRSGGRRQWIEFDCMAQYFGWGIGPAVMIEEYRRRLERAQRAGAEGAIFRTDWESLDGHTAFHTPNILNVYAGAMLSRELGTPAADIYDRWLADRGLLAAEDAESRRAASAWAERLFSRTWEVVRRALYMNDCVFNDSSTFPVGLAHAWWLAEEKNSLRDWDPSKADALAPTEENVRRILAEKDETLVILDDIARVLAEPPPGLAELALDDLRLRFDIFRRYVRGFRAAGRACILARYLTEGASSSAAFRAEAIRLFAAAQAELRDLIAEYEAFASATDHRYPVYLLLNPERLGTLADDLAHAVGARPAPEV